MIEKLISSEEYRTALGLPPEKTENYSLLARGEYNINYLFIHPVTGQELLLRVNAGSQMHLEKQIEYEAHALELLSGCGRTPKVIYTDGSKRFIDHGILVMEFLPGTYPDYNKERDMNAAVRCLADIHSVSIPEDEVIWGEPGAVPRDTTKLIAPADPAEAILDECEVMFSKYMDSPLGNDKVKARLRKLLDRGHELAKEKNSDNTYRCCVNTELNSTNFLLYQGFARLVDWEKPLYADPAQDLAHLLAPTTTFWQTDVILTQDETRRLTGEYIKAVSGRFDTSGLRNRTDRLISITCLRGLTWCAMAWVEYQDPDKLIINESTRIKLDAYLSDEFIGIIEARLGV